MKTCDHVPTLRNKLLHRLCLPFWLPPNGSINEKTGAGALQAGEDRIVHIIVEAMHFTWFKRVHHLRPLKI